MLFVALIVLILLSAFFSGIEIAYFSSNRLRVEIDRDRGGATGRILTILFHHPETFLSTMLVGNNIVLVMYGLVVASLLDPVLEPYISNPWVLILINALISTFLIIIFGEYLPKSYFKRNANRAMRYFSLPIFFFYILLYPISALTSWLSRMLLKMVGKEGSDRQFRRLTTVDLDHYLSSSVREDEPEGNLNTEVKIMQKAIEFSEVRARDCMVPRNEIVACELETDAEELRQMFIETGLSKIVIYNESIDDVIGYIHSSEMFKGPKWQERMKEAIFVAESAPGQTLMKQLMREKKSIAIVVDELGGTAGIITLEDLVEEIFGEIEDEHDTKTHVARAIDDKNFVLSARMEIDEVNELFNLDLPESDDYNTIAGYILQNHGDIPVPREQVEIDRFRFTILRSSSTRIELVKLTLLDN